MIEIRPHTITLLATILMLLTACTGSSRVPDPRPMFATPTTKRLVHEHKLKRVQPSLQTYLDSQYQQFSAQPNASVLLFEDREPFAFLIDSSRVGISCGLISLATDDADIAFVLAHEAAHLTLKHYLLEHPGPDEELQADDVALNTLITSGYSTENTYKIISKLYQHNEHLNSSYPSTPERLYQYWLIRAKLKNKISRRTSSSSRQLVSLKEVCGDIK